VASRTGTVLAVIVACALSVSSAIFLILELDQPIRGFMQISDAPPRNAISGLTR
jgi:hypothetical protein